MGFRFHPPPAERLFGYDPVRDLPENHLARFVEMVVEEACSPLPKPGPGQPAYDPRLCLKVLVYGYATGVRSSRQLERLCRESLPYLFLTRGEAPSYRTLCSFRRASEEEIEAVLLALYQVAAEEGIRRLGRITVDSTKMRAHASSESVVPAREYEKIKAEFARILQEAEETDEREESEGRSDPLLDRPVKREQMRDILRRIRKKGASAELAETRAHSPQMLERLAGSLQQIEQATAQGRKHVCLTDPDSRMMSEGREKGIRQCHSFEVAVDNGLIVAGGSCQDNFDTARLQPLVEAAEKNEPAGVQAVDADCGYYSGDAVGRLREAGVDTCIPDSNTACDLHRNQPIGTTRARSQGRVAFVYVAEADRFTCPEGNELLPYEERQGFGKWMRIYRARRDCTPCPRKDECLVRPNAKRRTVKVGRYDTLLEAARQRFADKEHVDRYHHRAEAVETVFGFLRGALGYSRWLLRGTVGTASEARYFKAAYQIRKVHRAWAA